MLSHHLMLVLVYLISIWHAYSNYNDPRNQAEKRMHVDSTLHGSLHSPISYIPEIYSGKYTGNETISSSVYD